MSIALLYERSENDENGIKLTAEQLGIDLTFIPFRKIALSIGKNGFSAKTKGKDYTQTFQDTKVVLNRAQSKNRRLQASYIMEMLGKKSLNSSQIEFVCYSKLRTLLNLYKEGLPIPKTVFVPCDATDIMKNGKEIHNQKDIADLLEPEFSLNEGIVIKADAGTHGKMIMLSKNREELEANIKETKPGIINPIGVVAQELVQKWFYDLRIIVHKEKGKQPTCYHTAMARAGFKDFRTNTFLGNLVFHSKLPIPIQELAIKCGETLGKGGDAYIFALDAMVNVGNHKNVDEAYLKQQLNTAAQAWLNVQKVKQDETRLTDFEAWNSKLETAFKSYKATAAYENINRIIEESVEQNQKALVFHESNSCPEFWENTRLATGLNVAEPLLKMATSLAK
ncbi:MAG: ATP-grasp domain-containing protein [Candidatus Bathyarchaeia archaeon]|jgi:glutathione synthase/RimK-type ligase-like ATP-grasp enzyme